MPDDRNPPDPDHDPLDEIGRRAGAELRRPAPLGGAALVRRSVGRRRTATAVGGGVAVVVLVAGGIALATRNGGGTVVTDDPATTPTPSLVPETTAVPGTAAPPETTVVQPTTTMHVPAVPAISDEVLPDPLAFAADGFERVLEGRTLIVRSDPEQVIPLEMSESELLLLGVGPNGVAYLRADADGLTRIVAVPTTGPTTGSVYELLAPYEHDGPWIGFMTSEGIDPFSNSGDMGLVPYVDPDGQPLADPVDPTFTWRVEYRFLDDGTGTVQPVAVGAGAVHELPVTEPGREGQFDRDIRPLPDGRVTVTVLPASGASEVWAFDPATETWTVHPSG